MRLLLTTVAVLLALFTPISQAALLYKVSGNELDKPSYLFGTMHILCAEDFRVPEQLEQRFSEVDQLVMELDLTSPEVIFQSASLMVNRNGPYLEQHLSDDQLTQVAGYIQENLNMSIPRAQRINPFVLSTQIMIKQLPCANTASYEGHLLTLAMAAEKPIKGLETAAFQLGLFDQIPIQNQVDMIWQMIDNKSQSVADFKAMTELYLAEDIDQLYQLIANDPSLGDFQQLILDRRNQDWLTKIPSLMRERSSLIAVGAGHLGGEQGVVRLLRQAGYQVTPVN
ncbi:TraB/GumN family protein [Pseudidiomarina mangrovi]|uniref:TraB/GumN family protein n=1 Tax=Pseudidiomarina mangrovi TaxID=2487133 RepID=UPI000FCA1DBA|nr:TraB/GumN family protein [Pseudidiomarina mangrovi]